MDWLTYVQWKYVRHGVVIALCLAGSGPDKTYNALFSDALLLHSNAWMPRAHQVAASHDRLVTPKYRQFAPLVPADGRHDGCWRLNVSRIPTSRALP
ncbi:hypothetical protein AB4Y32_05005 [Paraburkholderia phymatum]|uniref:Uncharacterized protein n=1 Tax=Paraburkholderia phymatum TaxID=148447 RepID=A0ACC6TVB5_9BURK